MSIIHYEDYRKYDTELNLHKEQDFNIESEKILSNIMYCSRF